MATTTVNTRTELIDTQSVVYIRQMSVKVTAKECKPNTRLYPYFDGIRVDEYIILNNGLPGDPLFTDADGGLSAVFNIPGFKFTTGTKIFSLSESQVFQPLDSALLGTGTGCRATFTTNGVKNSFQTTVDTTNTVTVENVVRVEIVDNSLTPRYSDPVAQSFNTFGVKGGCFVLKIDLYFYSKDASVPVSLELREMVNGYPTHKALSKDAIVSLLPEYVNVTTNASTPTRFYFKNPVYLEEDKEYCFVVMTNSKLYNIFTSVLGEKSLEDGTVVFEQPYLGSVFKSQNNYTWTAAQYEDLKFELFIAEFDISANAIIPMSGSAKTVTIPSKMLHTVSGSNLITATLTHKHGLTVGSYVQIGVDTSGTYNGIPGTAMLGSLDGIWEVSTVYDDYMFRFAVGANATSTGKILHGNTLQAIHVDNGGIGYNEENPPTVIITGVGSGAVANAIVRGGKVVQVIVTNRGIGYSSPPTISFSSTVGSGAVAVSSLDIKFGIITNRLAHTINPGFSIFTPSGTSTSTTLKNTVANFDGGNLNTYSSGKDIILNTSIRSELDQNILVCSMANELYKLSGNRSTVAQIELSSTNKNVSPMLDVSNCTTMFYNNNINNQGNDLIDTDESSGSVETITVVNGGSGYNSVPNIVITSSFGSGATATATVVGGSVTAITITNAGTGYMSTPTVSIVGGTPTITAVATATLTKYNTEISPIYGRAFARYVTKRNVLQTVSRGVKVFATMYSSENTSVDFYIRTSLSSETKIHTDQKWTLLRCDIARNKSKSKSEFFEYMFNGSVLSPFDTYDLKIVMNSKVPYDVPIVDNYRAIIIV